jgi:hypothetical protein
MWSALGPVPVRLTSPVYLDDGTARSQRLMGKYDPNERVIVVDSSASELVQLQTAVHEAVHCWLMDCGIRLGKLEEIVVDTIATAPNVPLSSTPRIDRDEIIEMLEEALARLPDELRQARWMLKERQEFVTKTRREADEILEAARVQAERMVQRTEVVRAAEQRARQVSEAADADARRRRHELEDFLDQRLASFEILLDKLTRTVEAGRARLHIGDQQAEQPSQPAPQRDHTGEDPSMGFFDQDR